MDPTYIVDTVGSGSNATAIVGATSYVPNPKAADGMDGQGSNAHFIPESAPVPSPNKADGLDGSWSRLPFSNGVPAGGAPVPHPSEADDR